jgi:hypothetical protein
VDFDLRSFVHGQGGEAVEVTLNGMIVFDGDLTFKAAVRPYTIALSTWARMAPGLTGVPISTADTTRLTCRRPFLTATSTTFET